MVWGSFRMGSDDRYLEERSVYRVKMDGFWINSSIWRQARTEGARFDRGSDEGR